jgi:hypothetical protein
MAKRRFMVAQIYKLPEMAGFLIIKFHKKTKFKVMPCHEAFSGEMISADL